MHHMKTPIGLVALSMLAGFVARAAEAPAAPVAGYSPTTDTLVYVGTYTGTKSKGIHLFRLPVENGEVSLAAPLVPLGLAVETPSPSFLAVDEKRRLLFAANETGRFEGQPTGSVSAFAIDPATGKLSLLNARSSMGSGPCHLVLSKDGRHVLVANYNGGSVAVLRVEADGRLGETTAFVQHAGKSVNPQRQAGPHAHCVTLDAANRFAFVCDLGLDQILVYRFDTQSGKLTPAEPAFTKLKPGAGPRHMVFRSDERFAYVVNELDSSVTTFAYDAGSGRLTDLGSVSTLPAGFDGRSSCAEIAVTPTGKFLYASNRGHNSLAVYAIDGAKGTLTLVEHLNTGGRTPRHFGLLPSGRELAIANQDTDNVLLCRIDPATGKLTPAGTMTAVPSPVCVVFLPPVAAARR
jgi:6-phosphogluconolactonase